MGSFFLAIRTLELDMGGVRKPRTVEQNRRRREDYAARKAAGELPALTEEQKQAVRDYNKKRRDAFKAAGKCISCGEPTVDGRVRCSTCELPTEEQRQYRREYAKQRYVELKASGRCTQCKALAVKGKVYCQPCLDKASERYRQEWGVEGRSPCIPQNNGACYKCGGSNDTLGALCLECFPGDRHESAQYQTAVRNARRAKGLCASCGERPAVEGGYLCRVHTLKQAACRFFGSSAGVDELEKLLASQGGVCRYTGELLVIGGGASVDHIVPKSKGGPHTLSNYQWVTFQVNKMKNDLTHDEFIAMCQLIADRSRGIL